MRRTELLQEVRKMRFEEVLGQCGVNALGSPRARARFSIWLKRHKLEFSDNVDSCSYKALSEYENDYRFAENEYEDPDLELQIESIAPNDMRSP